MNHLRLMPVVASVMALAPLGLGAQTPAPGAIESIDSLVVRTLARQRIAGAAVSIVVDGRVVHQRGYGVADRSSNRPVDAETTVFGLSSISKVFTTIALLRQVEAGAISVDSPAVRYAGIDGLSARIKVRDLLTHSAGFDERTIGISARRADDIIPLREYLQRSLPPVVRDPGVIASYSNHGFALAGLLVEAASATPFASYIDEQVLRPIGMHHSSMQQPLSGTLENARAIPYRRDGSVVPRILFNDSPASAMYSSAGDMGRFMVAFLAEAGLPGVLQSTEPMRVRQFAHHPALNGLTFGMRERRDVDIASVEQGGDWDDYSSDLILSPTTRTGLFVTFSGDAAAPVADTAWELLLGVSPDTTKLEREPAGEPPPSRWDGMYRLNRHSRTSLARLGVLTGAIREIRVERGAMLGKQLRQVSSGVYRLGTTGPLVAMRESAAGTPTHLFVGSAPYVAYERVRWWESRPFHLAAFMLSTLIFFIVIWRAAFKWPLSPVNDMTLLEWRRSMGVAAGCGVILLLGIGITLSTIDVSELQYGLPVSLQAVFVIGTLTIPCALIALGSAMMMWTRSIPNRVRIGTTIASCGAAVFACLVIYWRLMPTFA